MTEQARPQDHASSTPDFDFAGEISTIALVRVLVKKGIVTPAELRDEERDRRDSITSTIRMREHGHDLHDHPDHRPRLKRWAAKKHWRRRLTRLLFGWKWKKVKTHTDSDTEKTDS